MIPATEMAETFCNFLNVFIPHKNSENSIIYFPNYIFLFIISINFPPSCFASVPSPSYSDQIVIGQTATQVIFQPTGPL